MLFRILSHVCGSCLPAKLHILWGLDSVGIGHRIADFEFVCLDDGILLGWYYVVDFDLDYLRASLYNNTDEIDMAPVHGCHALIGKCKHMLQVESWRQDARPLWMRSKNLTLRLTIGVHSTKNARVFLMLRGTWRQRNALTCRVLYASISNDRNLTAVDQRFLAEQQNQRTVNSTTS